MTKALLITGATGKQGSSVINALLKVNADFEILALTRNAQSASAQKLQAKSQKIKVIAGNLDNLDDVFEKAKQATQLPIWGVFSVQVSNATNTLLSHLLLTVFIRLPLETERAYNPRSVRERPSLTQPLRTASNTLSTPPLTAVSTLTPKQQPFLTSPASIVLSSTCLRT
jgi:NAD(P)-dependent dehydrogenase (short-subunit alcohol dehydrogenase family)